MIDPSRPHSARVWNYWLGGKDWYAVDEEVGQRIATAVPDIVDAARGDRSFLRRVVTLLTAEHGIRQFLDIGTGLPTMDNTHQVAQRIDPTCRVVYVDRDPVVLAHARAMLKGNPQGATAYLDADAREPEKILSRAAPVLDFDQPIAVMLLAILHLIDDDEAYGLVERLVAALPAGSFLVLSHACLDHPSTADAVAMWNASGSPTPVRARSAADIARFFDGLDLLDPGVVTCTRWRPEPDPAQPVMTFGGLAHKS